MDRKVIVAIVVVVAILAGGGALLAVNKNSDKTDSNTASMSTGKDMSNMDSSSSDNTTGTPAATSSVTIDNFAFSPADITVKKGTTVTWTNKDSSTHTVTETDSKTGPDSGNLANGKTYSFTYNTVGTFKYHCSIHPDMTGTVTVTE